MKAEEMFNKLGYIEIANYHKSITYRFTNKQHCEFTIVIELEYKTYRMMYRDWKLHYPKHEYFHINLEEHKAITQQMKELGWLDD